MSHYNQAEYSDDDSRGRTLYVGNLDPSITEDFIAYLFGQFGPVVSCKIIHEPNNDPYCFVEFSNILNAETAKTAMDKRNCFNRDLKVNWASNTGSAPKLDTSKHHHVFVGDLCPEIDANLLRDAFKIFGEVSDVKIICDPTNHKPKGYGFVSFVHKEDAKEAINGMNGELLGSRNIRTNWATRKPVPPHQREGSGYHPYHAPKQLNYEDVDKMSSSTNCTVYCGQGLPNLTEEVIRNEFNQFGEILEIRIFKDKGYAFVRFQQKKCATTAIVEVNGREINGVQCRCSWGKESNESATQPQAQQQQGAQQPSAGGYNQSSYYNQYQQNMPYGYNQYPGYMQQGAAYQQYYGGGYGMPQGYGGGGGGGMHMQGGGPHNQGYNGYQ